MTAPTQMPSEPDIKCMFKDEAFGALKDYASALRAHAESLQAEVERLRTGDTCGRQCEGTAYRIEARQQKNRAESAERKLAEVTK